jgi:TniQ
MESLYRSRSRLYNMAPLNNEDYIESLTSYIIRISYEHNVYPIYLINNILFPVLEKEFLMNSSERGGNRFYDGAKTLNSFNESALDMVDALKKLTNINNLHHTTLYGLKNIITSRGLFSGFIQWCPLCYVEQLKRNNQVYSPLVWFLQSVKTCSIHKCYLVQSCLACKKRIPILHRKSVNGFCPFCQIWLGSTCVEEASAKAVWKAKQIQELIIYKNERSFPDNNDQTVKNLNCLCLYLTAGNIEQFARLFSIPKTTMWDWCHNKVLIPLERLLEICYECGLILVEFYIKDISIPLFLDSNKIQQSLDLQSKQNKLLRNSHQHFQGENVATILDKYLDTPIKSMNDIALESGYSRRTLYKHFPEICKEISFKYKQNKEQQAYQKYIGNCRLITRSVEECIKNDIYPSRRRIEELIGKPALLREKRMKLHYKNELERSFL